MMLSTMKVYIVAATLGEYQDALRRLGLHERAAVHVVPAADGVTAIDPWPDGPVYLARFGQLVPVYRVEVCRRAA